MLVAFDFSVAFDPRDHSLLLEKAFHLGFWDSVSLACFPSYFTGQGPMRKNSRTFYKSKVSRGIIGCIQRERQIRRKRDCVYVGHLLCARLCTRHLRSHCLMG